MHEAMLITYMAHHVVTGKRCFAGTCTATPVLQQVPTSMALHRLVASLGN